MILAGQIFYNKYKEYILTIEKIKSDNLEHIKDKFEEFIENMLNKLDDKDVINFTPFNI
jgi:hypothetical protein